MRLAINGKNIEITQPIREYVEEKVGRVVRHYDQIMNIEVTLSVIKNPSVAKNHTAEASCDIQGTRLHVTEDAESMYASIDLLADKLDRQAKKHKEKLTKGKAKSGSIRTDIVEEAEVESEDEDENEEIQAI